MQTKRTTGNEPCQLCCTPGLANAWLGGKDVSMNESVASQFVGQIHATSMQLMMQSPCI